MMGKVVGYTTVDRVLSKLYRDLGLSEISETDVTEWIGEAIEAIGAISHLEEVIAFMEVNNHKVQLPPGLQSIIQIARNNQYIGEDTKDACVLPVEIATDCDKSLSDCGCSGEGLFTVNVVMTNCAGELLDDYNVAYYRPIFDLQADYILWAGNSSIYREKFSPVRLSNHNFLGSLVCHEDAGLYNSCSEEYTISGGNLIFSFKEGQIVLGYRRIATDDESGAPLIPDEVSTIEAITSYVTYKYMARLWYLGREGYSDKMQKAEADWFFYKNQAINKARLPHGLDQFEKFKIQKYNLTPDFGRYSRYGK